MKTAGIVAEYNPLHAGHAWHIQQTQTISGADAMVCVLSSQFVQRGEPALVSKQARARMALMNGIDLVIELPSAFSCASAEYFASSAVKLLDSLGVVDVISFGSEEGSLEALDQAAELLADESDAFRQALKSHLGSGLSYPAARQKAMAAFIPEGAQQAVSSPNNILGIEYLKALRRQKSRMEPLTVPRMGQGYKGETLETSFSSATAIRKHLMAAAARPVSPVPFSLGAYTVNVPFQAIDAIHAPDALETVQSRSDDASGPLDTPAASQNQAAQAFNPFEQLAANMPAGSLDILRAEMAAGRGPVFLEDFRDILFYRLRTASDDTLAALPYMEEGLHNRIRKAAMQEDSLEGLIKSCTTSRYPAARIRRILCALLLGMTDVFLNDLQENGYAQYIRVLGFNEKGRKLLAQARKKATLPLLIKPSHYKKLENPLAIKLFEHEIRASDVYVMAYKFRALQKGGSELTSHVVMPDTLF